MRFGSRLLIPAALAALTACSDASIGAIESGPTRPLVVDLDGPRSSLGSWRYYDGVRLLECDVVVEAWAEGGSSSATAEWLDGVVDIYDLRTGEYLGSEYLYPGEVEYVWGSREIENGEHQRARPLRYSSYGPFSVDVLFRYATGRGAGEATHRFDCR